MRALIPWFSIWVNPRRTISQVIEKWPLWAAILTTALAGIADSLNRAFTSNRWEERGAAYVLSYTLALGPVITLAVSSLTAVVGTWIGRKWNGKATVRGFFTALALAEIPSIFTLALWVPLFVIVGPSSLSEGAKSAELALLFVFLALSIFKLFIVIFSVAEVQKFSPGDAFLNLLVAVFLLLIPIILVAMARGTPILKLLKGNSL